MGSTRQLVEEYVDSIIQPITSGTGMAYDCRRDGDRYFVKVREGGPDHQSYGVWKEYALCSHHPTPEYAPTADFVAEDETHVVAGFEYVPHASTGNRIYDDRAFYQVFREELYDFLHTLHDVDSVHPHVAAFRGETYYVNNRLTDGATHFFKDPIPSRPYFTDAAFETYEPLLTYAQQELAASYNPEDAVLIHDSLSNPENILCTQDGIAAVVDWEYFDWFDRLHELAAVEVAFVDELAAYYDGLSVAEERRAFREEFDIADDDKRRLRLYKAWFNYFQLQYYDGREEAIPGDRQPKDVAAFFRGQLDSLTDQLL